MDSAAAGEALADEDVQSRILRNTLSEVAAGRSSSSDNDGSEATPTADEAHAHAHAHQPAKTTTTTAKCCVICLDSVAVAESCEARPCGHADFDYLCLLSWLERGQPKCPLCKADVREVRRQPRTDDDDDDDDGGAGSYETYIVPRPPRKQPANNNNNPSTAAAAAAATSSTPHSSSRDFLLLRHRRRHFSNNPNPNRPPPPPQPGNHDDDDDDDQALRRRQTVYREGLYSLHVGANRTSRYRRELTPQLFAAEPDLVSRARAFLRRELRVFEFLRPEGSSSSFPSTSAAAPPPAALGEGEESSASASAAASANPGGRRASRGTRETLTLARRRASNAEFLLEYVVAIAKTVDTQGSQGQAVAMLADFLGRDHAALLLHELRSYLRSPHGSLEAWDRHVQYLSPVAGSRAAAAAAASRPKRSRSGRSTSPQGSWRRGEARWQGDSYRPDYSGQRHGRARSPGRSC
jgi:hypothetical protein